MFNKTMTFVNSVCKFNNPETVKEVRKVLLQFNNRPVSTMQEGSEANILESFEMAQLANLLPEKVEEATTLIPSYSCLFSYAFPISRILYRLLHRIDEDDLQTLLNDLHNLERFQ
jgi:hypothetical protein